LGSGVAIESSVIGRNHLSLRVHAIAVQVIKCSRV
jgi:hypothetical protein